jgi:hypothetical protein
MNIIKTDNQKDYIVKFCHDIAKIVLAITVIAPAVHIETFNILLFFGGLWVTIVFFLIGFILAGKI